MKNTENTELTPDVLPPAEQEESAPAASSDESPPAEPAPAPPDKPEHGLSSQFVRDCLNSNALGDGTLFAQINRHKFLYVASSKLWFAWMGHYWDVDYQERYNYAVENVVEVYNLEAAYIKKQIEKAQAGADEDQAKRLGGLYKKLLGRISKLRDDKGRKSCVLFARTCADPLSIKGDELDQNTNLIVFINGVVDIRTGELRPGRPSDMLRTNSPTQWLGLDTPCPLFDKAVLDILGGDESLVRYVQRSLGAAMGGNNAEQKFHIWHGEDGRNGKGIIKNMVMKAMGRGYTGPIKSSMLTLQRFKNPDAPSASIMYLRGKRWVFASELSKGETYDTSQVKLITGKDPLNGRSPNDKFETDFDPTHTVFLQTNNNAHADADDRAMYARVLVVKFEQVFCAHPEADNEHPIDPMLDIKLMAELPGIAAWLMRGYFDYLQQGLNPPPKVIAWTDEYRQNEDCLGSFIEAECELGPGLSVSSSNFAERYVKWWEFNISKKPPHAVTIGRSLAKRFKDNYKSNGCTIYRGLALKSDY